MPKEESVQGDAEALHFGEMLECNAGKEGERINRLPFSVTLARVEDERYLNWKSPRAVPATNRRTAGDGSSRQTSTAGGVGGFIPRRPGGKKGSGRRSGDKAPPVEARTRGVPPRLRCSRTRARLSRRPAVPAGVKNGVTRSERGGHLQPLGTSTERVRAEERCASAPETVPGNSHLTGEASSSSPEVWRFCAAGEEAAAAAAEAAECLPIPGCETVCWLASDPRPGARKINSQTHGSY